MTGSLPTERVGTPVDGVAVLGALSPSRAGDFKACPLLFRLRTIDRLPELPSPAAVRGTVVHKVLEDLFDLAADDRTAARADAMIPAAWAHVREHEAERAAIFADPGSADEQAWLTSCSQVLATYFDLEDPRRVEPAERELYVEALLDSRLLLRGYIDRVDVAPDGAIRINDYKTGRSAKEGFEAAALFQLKFYALILWLNRGRVPSLLRLLYLGDGVTISYAPDEQDLRATQRVVEALWVAIREAQQTGDWQPSRSAACGWCSFKAFCPEFGGTPPPLPQGGVPTELVVGT
ncbi:MAG: PD-(D/E)XK nuclease family protein [Propionibacteriales bacterium]|nr:PD-(D/E)XK nuclease family protein [Propionibacteriales bacterium]